VQSLTVACIDPFAEADEDSGQTTQTQEYIHIRIQRMFASSDLTPHVTWSLASETPPVALSLSQGWN
jgi:hypothetical protein